MIKKSLAFIFPGQGSQKQGMLGELADQTSLVKEIYAEAATVLGYDLWSVVQNGPEQRLNQTQVTQPALLVGGYCMWRIWLAHHGPRPAFMAGHSLGEYTALVCARALDFRVAVALVAKRGQYMQAAVPEGVGAMAAIVGLDDARVAKICADAATDVQVLTPANYNSSGQVVIAGHKQAVEKAVDIAEQEGARMAKLLAVSVPSHCMLMKPAADQLAKELEHIELRHPDIPVINNVAVREEQAPEAIKQALIEQLYQPVRWVEIIQKLAAVGVDTVVECGPGRVLSGLNKRIDRSITALPTNDLTSLTKALTACHQYMNEEPLCG